MELRKFFVSSAPAGRVLTMLALAFMAIIFAGGRADAASSRFCEGGRWVTSQQGDTLFVRGTHVQFDVDLRTGGVRNWTLTGAPNVGRLVERPTVIFSEKTPLHGAVLTRTDRLRNDKGDLVLIRTTGDGSVEVKIQAKDCAQGGVFQMEVERADNTATVFTHVLADNVFYFDNPNVRDRLGERIPCSGMLPDGRLVSCEGANADGTVTVTARVNFANDWSPKFVGRDSSQLATRIAQGCPNDIPNPLHPGSVNHCGGVSQWSVQSGGRLGQVMGEDSTEIAPAATACAANCTAQNQVNGRAVVVGFPFPVPQEVRLKPRYFNGFVFP